MIHPDPDVMNFKDAVEAVSARATAAQDRIVHLQSEIIHWISSQRLKGKTTETTQAAATLEVALALNALVYVQSLKILMEHPGK
jgi:hypothetical protein